MDVREIEDVSAHVRTQEKKDCCSAYILECLGSLSRCFSKFGDFGLIFSVVLDVRVFMRTMRIGVFPWTM